MGNGRQPTFSAAGRRADRASAHCSLGQLKQVPGWARRLARPASVAVVPERDGPRLAVAATQQRWQISCRSSCVWRVVIVRDSQLRQTFTTLISRGLPKFQLVQLCE